MLRAVLGWLGPSEASGPRVARVFHVLLALVFLVAWLSLGVQVRALIGSRGLLPVAGYLDAARAQGLGLSEIPTVFWWSASDTALVSGIGAGVALSVLALAGVAPRVCFGLGTALYLSYVAACRTFLSFQWDNLLLECGALAVLLPRHGRRGAWVHALFRILLFKLYFESGLAKWESAVGDWQDGSAMTFYYETAPLPTALAWFAHALPDGWHHLESRLTLFLELPLPLAFFAGRRWRLGAAAVLGAFQLVNGATANYGFFVHLALALEVFLLDDADVERAGAWLRSRWRRAGLLLARARRRLDRATGRLAARWRALRARRPAIWRSRPARALRIAVAAAYVSLSVADGLVTFTDFRAVTPADLGPLSALRQPLRLVNTYHLFAQITRERIEPEVQIAGEGETWEAQDLRYKAGDVRRAPSFVAPHQPRLDFQLWFYGLSFGGGMPGYVGNLLARVCWEPSAVQGFFRAPLPAERSRVRIGFWRYVFTAPDERRATGAWWRREWLGATRPLDCK